MNRPPDNPGRQLIRSRSWRPTTLAPAGLVGGGILFALSLFPSLLPRSILTQGIVSGVMIAAGYALGTLAGWTWDYLEIPALRGRVRRTVRGVVAAVLSAAIVAAIWQHVGWQNEVRQIMGIPSTTPATWPPVAVLAVAVAVMLGAVARGVRRAFRSVVARLGRRMPGRLARVAGIAITILMVWGLWSGVIVTGFFTLANRVSAPRDAATDPGVTRPTAPTRSGSPDSLVAWDTLGRKGRSFVATGPTVQDLNRYSGGGASPLSGPMPVSDQPTAPKHVPSWISLLADQQAVQAESRVVFETIHTHWASLPEANRPRLYLYGMSLGSLGLEAVLTSVNIINEPIDGALLVGPPFVDALHDRLVKSRNPDTPPWLPVHGTGRTIRFMARGTEVRGLDAPDQPWGPTRIVYLQNTSDPVVYFDPEIAFEHPDWLEAGQRGPDLSEDLMWTPVITMWQLLLDLPMAATMPDGYGHNYTIADNIRAWAAITRPHDWSPTDTRDLSDHLKRNQPPSSPSDSPVPTPS